MAKNPQKQLKDLVARRIRELRLRRGMTQSQLGEHIGSAKPHVSELENGKTSPGIGLLAKLAAALQVEPADLLREG
jgi:transcriptional regulator with XRE-family HTH domain